MKKNFLQLIFSNVLLHLKYKVLLRNNRAGGKALTTDHRAHTLSKTNC